MSGFVFVGVLCGFAIWGFACHLAYGLRAATIVRTMFPGRADSRSRNLCRAAIQPLVGLLVLVIGSTASFGQAATSSVMPANPTYVDAVTGIVTIPAVAGQPPLTTTITYSVDGGTAQTATVTTGNNYLNLGQLAVGTHAMSIGSPGADPPITLPPPVTFPVIGQSFSFVGVFGHFYPSYTDAHFFTTPAVAIKSSDTVYVADTTTNKIAVFDTFGNITALPITTLPFPTAGPTGLAFDNSDNLFISDHGNSRVVKYTPAGVETVLSITGLGKPGQLVLDKANDLLYIVDQDNDRALDYDGCRRAILFGSNADSEHRAESISIVRASSISRRAFR